MHAELTDDGKHITITASYAENKLISSLPGVKYSRKDEWWAVPATWANCLIMRCLFKSSLKLGPRLIAFGWSEAKHENEVSELGNALDSTADYDKRLFGYQKAGAEYMRLTGRALLADEPGLGKTAQSIVAVKQLHEQGEDVFPVLVVCPNSMKRTWQRELEQWWPEKPGQTQIVDGSATARRNQLTSGANTDIINWEAVRLHSNVSGFGSIRLNRCAACGGIVDPRPGEEYKGAVPESKCEAHKRELNAKGYKTVIIDEGHKAKDEKSKQTRAVWSLAHSAQYCYVLTGTPIADNVGDLWSILHALDALSFPVKSKFLDIFAVTRLNFFGGFEVLGLNPERADTLRRILALYMRRTPKSIALPQLPPRLPTTYRYVKMKPAQAKQYRQMKDGCLTMLNGDRPLTVAASIAQFARLRQFACGTGIWDEAEGKVKLSEPSCKTDDLVEFLQDNPKPLVVAAESYEIIELAAKRLESVGYKIGLITGAQTIDERDVAVREFQAGNLDVILMTLKAGGVGITLTAADTIYFMEQSSSRTDNKQGEDRVYRIGSEIHDAVRVVVCITEGTIEENRDYLLAIKDQRFEEAVQDKERVKRMLQ